VVAAAAVVGCLCGRRVVVWVAAEGQLDAALAGAGYEGGGGESKDCGHRCGLRFQEFVRATIS
jgi:hypothetical protein